VFAAQAGPGIENAFPGVAQAFSENVPLLVIVRSRNRPWIARHRSYSHDCMSWSDDQRICANR